LETEKIGIKILTAAVSSTLLIEWGARGLAVPPMMVLGVARIFETTVLLSLAALFAGKGLQSVGIQRGGLLRGIKRGCLWSLGFGVIVATVYGVLILSRINGLAFPKIDIGPIRHQTVLLFVVGALISPVAEELFFRGFLYGYFRRWGVIVALPASTLLFVLAHTVTTGKLAFPQIVGGLLFAIAYEKEKNLLVPVTIHMLGNLALFSIALVS
jgi:membrane protease YdiL (CAAX protease family)